MRIIKESINITHSYDENGEYQGYIEQRAEEYLYDSEEERRLHIEIMGKNGFEASEKIKMDVKNDFWNPEYVWYGMFVKIIKHPVSEK